MIAVRPSFAQCALASDGRGSGSSSISRVHAPCGIGVGLCQKSSGWWNSTVGLFPGLYISTLRELSVIGTQALKWGFTLYG